MSNHFNFSLQEEREEINASPSTKFNLLRRYEQHELTIKLLKGMNHGNKINQIYCVYHVFYFIYQCEQNKYGLKSIT